MITYLHLECGIKKLISQGAGFDVYFNWSYFASASFRKNRSILEKDLKPCYFTRPQALKILDF